VSIPEHPGLSLLDVAFLVTGGWALPAAVSAGASDQRSWQIAAYAVGALLSFVSTYGFKRLRWFLFPRCVTYAAIAKLSPSIVFACLSVGMLGVNLLLQVALYRIALLAFRTQVA
jgi:hypothetical protein